LHEKSTPRKGFNWRGAMTSLKNYAIFGGSFDPIHNAHIIIAQKILEFLTPLKKLYIVPAGCSPFKTGDKHTPYAVRYSWCKQAFSGIDGIDILDIEKGTGIDKPSYTIDTLNRFKIQFTEYPVIIIGQDSLQSFHRWKDANKILEKTTLAVYKRKNSSGISETEKRYPDRVTVYDTSYIEISSTEIRERISQGKSIRGFVPQSIEDEIIKHYSL
jgi:nicotinate-nucleotide adenylyltransferase